MLEGRCQVTHPRKSQLRSHEPLLNPVVDVNGAKWTGKDRIENQPRCREPCCLDILELKHMCAGGACRPAQLDVHLDLVA